MNFYLGVTDNDWFRTLRAQQAIECNFWMPSGKGFGLLQPGQEFLFKRKAPHNDIGGGGTFVRSEQLPLRMAWEVFGVANGCATFEEFARKIIGYRAKTGPSPDPNPMITCVVLEGTIFFNDNDTIPVPADWATNIVWASVTTQRIPCMMQCGNATWHCVTPIGPTIRATRCTRW